MIGCLILVLGLVVGFCWYTSGILGVGFLGLFLGLLYLAAAGTQEENECRLNAMAAEREGESICTFARALDFRAIDTWIIRAVYEELHKACSLLPLRPTDRLFDDLLIDEEDLDILAADMAYRARRQFDSTEGNSFVGKVETVHDLIQFLAHQPRLAMT